jgi:uncharacterized protein YodC (DUF2158 family)
MTVEDVYDAAYAYRYRCTWIDKTGKPQHDLFKENQLERLPEPIRDSGQPPHQSPS